MKRVIIVITVVLTLGAIVFFSIRAGDRKKAIRVYLEEIERQDIARLVKASGEIDPRVKVNLSAHVIARIERLFVEEGDSIEAGDPVLELEKEAFVAIRNRAVAELSIARSRLRQAEIELEDNDLKLKRMQRLADEMVISSEQLESSQLQHKSAELRLEQSREAILQAQASLEKAEDDLAKTTIFAPLSGRVIELRAEEGEVVVSGTMNNPASVIGDHRRSLRNPGGGGCRRDRDRVSRAGAVGRARGGRAPRRNLQRTGGGDRQLWFSAQPTARRHLLRGKDPAGRAG